MNQTLVNAVKNLIRNGTRYNVEALDSLYHPDLNIGRLENDDQVLVINKDENMAFFREKREQKAESLSTDAEYLYAHASGDTGHVAVKRSMQLKDRYEHLIYNLVLRKVDERWLVISEFVFPKGTE